MSSEYTGPDYIYSLYGTSWGVIRDCDGQVVRTMTLAELEVLDAIIEKTLLRSLKEKSR